MVPSTGDLMSRAPLASTSGASSRPVIGCSVLISMNSLPLTSPAEKTVRPVEDAPHAVILGDDGNHDLGLGGDLAGIGGDPQSVGRQRAVDVGVVIPAHDVEALLTQALRYRRAHPAQSDNSDIHDVLPDPHNERL